MITIGIDPHKSSLTAVAVQPGGEVSATIRLEVNRDTVALLRAWAQQWPQRQWAVEGAAGLGRGVAQGLAAADEPVVDVPAQLAARARLLNTGQVNKKVVNALGGGPLASSWQAAKLHRVADGDYSAQSRLSLALKDVHLALEAAEGERSPPLPAWRTSGCRPSIKASVSRT